jgi:hypothetical protein
MAFLRPASSAARPFTTFSASALPTTTLSSSSSASMPTSPADVVAASQCETSSMRDATNSFCTMG